MPRPTRAIRFQNVLGESDETPAAIPEGLSSIVSNWYKFRSGLRRRNGYTSLANSLGASNLRMVQWTKVNDEEHLIAVWGGDVRDWFADTPGDIAINGENRLPASGDADANSANVENQLLIGNGYDENVRYKPGGGGSSATAAQLDGSTQWYVNTASTDLSAGDIDFTLTAWVYLDNTLADQVVVSKFSATTSSQREYRIYFTPSTNKFVMDVWDLGSGTGGTASADDGSAITSGQWYFVVGWHDSVGNLVGISVNDATPVTGAWALGCTANTVDFYIGRQEAVAAALSGRIMRAGYWKSAGGAGGTLSAGQRTSLYNAGSGKAFADLTAGEQVALIAYWDFNAASGDDSSDVAATNDLTPVGTPTVALGVDTAIEVAQLMPAAPTTAPTVSLTVGATHQADTEQQGVDFVYRISFLNADGHPSEPSPEGLDAAYTFNLNFDVSVSNIPICPAGQDCTGRRIYRRSGGSTVFRFVDDILDNTTTVYADQVVNDDLGEAMPSDADGVPTNKAMPPAKYWCEHNARALAAWNTTLEGGKRTLFISNKFEPWYCPELPDLEDVTQGTRAFLQGAGAGEITGVGSHGAYGVVFTSAAGFFLTGDSPDTFAVNKFANHGCVAHRTICSARDLLLWLGPEGVYAWQSGVTRLVSDDQRETIEEMTAEEQAGAHAFVWEDRYYLCWATGALVVDLEYNFPHQWSTNTGWQWRDSTVSEFSGSEKEKIYAALEGEAQVYQLETTATDAGATIPARWASKDADCGAPAREKRVHYIELRFKKASSGTAIVSLKKGSGQTIQTWAHNLANVDHADETVSRFFQSCNEYARSEFFRIDVIVTSASSTPVTLLSAGLHWTLAT